MQYVTTRPYATAARQYETGDLIAASSLTSAEWVRGLESGAIVPARFVDTAAAIARRADIPGPGVQVFETDTGVLRIGNGVTAPGSLNPVLSGTYVPMSGVGPALRRGSSVIGWAGDSITAGTGASDTAHAFRSIAATYAGGLKIAFDSYNGGVAGETSADVLARMPTILAASTGPIHLMVGTNDAGNDVSYATYQANVRAIKALCDAAFRPLAISTIIPRGTGATQAVVDKTARFNLFLKTYCRDQNVPLADTYAALVDATTGLLQSGYDSGDHVHPNDAGHLAIAQTVWSTVAGLVPAIEWPVKAKNAGGLVPEPLVADTYGNLSFLSGFYAEVAFAGVAASGGDIPAGRWMRVSHNNTSGSTRNSTLAIPLTTGWSTGDTLAFYAYFRGSTAAALNKVGLANNAGSLYQNALDQPPTATPGPVYFTRVMQAGDQVNFAFVLSAPTGTTSYVDFGAIDVFNLTAMGLA